MSTIKYYVNVISEEYGVQQNGPHETLRDAYRAIADLASIAAMEDDGVERTYHIDRFLSRTIDEVQGRTLKGEQKK